MGSNENVDPEALRDDIDRIKDAMGIAERYDGAPEQWLLFGVFIALGSVLSQYVVLQELPGYWFAVVWLGLVGVGSTAIGYYTDVFEPTPDDKPSIGFQVFAPYAAGFPLMAALSPFLDGLSYVEESALVLGIALVLLGTGYVVAANSLRAYRIRARDRRAFAVGGVLMVVLGVAIPNVDALHTWGYTAFGASYVVYAAASYLVLTRT